MTDDEKLTAEKVVTIALLTVAACVPGIFVYLVMTLLFYPFFDSFSAFVSLLVIGVPLLIASAYLLKSGQSGGQKIEENIRACILDIVAFDADSLDACG